MKIALLSPYHGGSHQAWADGYVRSSGHEIRLLALPARFWKWRMHGGAVTLAREFLDAAWQPDLLLATDMLDLATFLALTRSRTAGLPAALYCHENQLTYPLPGDPASGPWRHQRGQRDQHYAWINLTSALAADLVFFNSHFHRDSFLDALPRFLKHFPEHNELEAVDQIAARSSVLPVGIDLRRLDAAHREPPPDEPPLVLWNQRWEYDKNPAGAFAALYAVQDAGIPFRLAVCGQNFRRQPAEFAEARERLRDRLVHFGYAKEARYQALLWEAVVTFSTAWHEFFGISVVEAAYCGALPLLPRRLSYPELVPPALHNACLYNEPDELVARLQTALTNPEATRASATQVAQAMTRFDWSRLAPAYDGALTAVAELVRGRVDA